MATSPNKKDKKDNETPADAVEVKRKLAWRMGLAGLMIVGLLGALALFDRLSTPSESEATPPQFTEPVPVAKKVITQPVTPAEPAAEPATPAPPPPAPAPEATAAPVDKSAPRSDRPPRPEVAAQPALPRASTVPAAPAGRAASAAPATSTTSATPARATRAEAPATRSEAPAAAEPPAPPRLFSGYALQAGVFADPRRAEDLHARLVLEGIPATIESRVQVGPFKSRAEAEVMRDKLKALGVESVLLPPKGARH